MKIPFEKKFLFIFLITALSVFTFSVITYRNHKSLADNNYWINHTQLVLYRTEKVLSDLKNMETGVRGYIITRDTAFLDPYNQARSSIIHNILTLSVLTKDNITQQLRIDTLYELTNKRIEQCTIISKIAAGNLKDNQQLLTIVRQGRPVMNSITKTIGAIENEESRLLNIRENISKESNEKMKARFLILTGSIFLAFLLAYLIMRYNISILKKDSKLLLQLNKKLKFLSKRIDDSIEGISDPFFALDQNRKFIYLNSAAQKKMNFPEGALIGKDIFKVFPDYKKNIIGQNMLRVQQTKNPMSFEAYDDIFKYWQDVAIYPTAEGMTVYIKDATSRKENEKELLKTKIFLEETNEVAHVGGWEVDMVKGDVYWSSMTRVIHETTPDYLPKLETGINFYKEGSNRELIKQLVNRAIDDGISWDAELLIITAKGSERWVRTRGKAEFDHGKCVRLFGTFQDINDQMMLQFKLQQSEKQFRSAFEFSAIGMALIGPGNKWKEVNESLCKSLGYNQTEIFKRTLAEITHPDDLLMDQALLQELIAGKRKSYQLEKRFFHKDGHIVWILLVVSMVKDPAGNIVHFIAQIQDISDKKLAEQKLTEERLLLRTIIDNLPLNVYLKDLDSKKILVNKSEIEYMGAKSENDILGKNDYDLYPDGSAVTSMTEDQQVFTTGEAIIDKETVSIKNDGTETWFLTSKIPFKNTQNELTGLLGISYDITVRNQTKKALQESEQKLSTLFDLSPVGFALNDYKSGEFLEYNNSFVKNIGFTREEFNSLGQKTMVQNGYWNEEAEMNKSVTETGFFGPLEKEYIKKDGKSCPILLNGLKVTDADGRELIWSVVQDISDLKLKEKQLVVLNLSIEERNRELAVKNEELEQFAYVASHDLQEPLRMVTGFLGKIEKKYNALLDEEGKKYIHFAVNGAIRMRSLITDILSYSGISTDVESAASDIDLNLVVRDITQSLELSNEARRPEIKVDELPVIHTNRIFMQQLFSNLINNAVKYQAPGSDPVVEVKVEEKKDAWKFSIADNGIGIDSKFAHKVFNVFQRLHTREQYSGTGIGLAICKKIVNKLGGEIWLESIKGKGSTFFFTIRK